MEEVVSSNLTRSTNLPNNLPIPGRLRFPHNSRKSSRHPALLKPHDCFLSSGGLEQHVPHRGLGPRMAGLRHRLKHIHPVRTFLDCSEIETSEGPPPKS